jgi:hypothetical protein
LALKLCINFPYTESLASIAYVLKHDIACIYKCETVALDRLKTGVCFLGSGIYAAGATATGYPWFNATKVQNPGRTAGTM